MFKQHGFNYVFSNNEWIVNTLLRLYVLSLRPHLVDVNLAIYHENAITKLYIRLYHNILNRVWLEARFTTAIRTNINHVSIYCSNLAKYKTLVSLLRSFYIHFNIYIVEVTTAILDLVVYFRYT